VGRLPAPGSHVGTVDTFDPRRGLGTVTDRADGSIFPFHATAIADGSRQVQVGTEVRFVVEPAHLGRYEARRIVALGATPSPD
jgi:cold shock CspA family protein